MNKKKVRYIPSKEEVMELKKDFKNIGLKVDKEELMRAAVNARGVSMKINKKLENELISDLADLVIAGISSDYAVKNVTYNDEGDKSRFNFEIEEFPDWVFGTWLTLNKKNAMLEIEWFTQQHMWVDKFKPCRSVIGAKEQISVGAIMEMIVFEEEACFADAYLGEVLSQLKFMKEHPYIASYRDYWEVDLNTEYITERKAKRIMKQAKKNAIRRALVEKKLEMNMLKAVLKELLSLECVNSLSIKDEPDCSPRFSITLYIADLFNEEQLEVFREYCEDTIDEIQHILESKKNYDKYSIRNICSSMIDIVVEKEDVNDKSKN